MPIRPFPFALGIGTDIVRASRIRTIILKGEGEGTARTKHLYRFMNHLLSSREQLMFWDKFEGTRNVYGPKLGKATEWLAGRWAAKEAVIKAVQYRDLSFLDVQILPSKPAQMSSPVYALILDKPAAARNTNIKVAPLSLRTDFAAPEKVTSDDAKEREGHDDASGQQRDGLAIAYEVQDDDPDGQVAKVNISHDGEYVTAVCLAADQPREGDVGGEAAAWEP
ncbi:hypothetical protein B0A55_01303 [Friedmanniomyces simplex]|uniref:4'-phosphopantetheinyl transferase domain-containing protein n=1 Tax=Friedmanniomyces simplex TaxID=329884 RepID=A0A4U0Y2E9_9PEZI|nr:hypothetical protein B0A55_01303 [Friedmanniomyces simplex]